jgi:hypothetical protein
MTTQTPDGRALMLAQTIEALTRQRNSALDLAAHHESRSVLQGEAIKAFEKIISEQMSRIAALEDALLKSESGNEGSSTQ